MTTKNEYSRQDRFRDWANYLKELPLNRNSIILDLGCGMGTVTKLLAAMYSNTVGIDRKTSFVNNGIGNGKEGKVSFINGDLRKVNDLQLPKADGIWCSFTAAYFPDFDEVFPDWIRLLNVGGWLAIIEVNDMFNHYPLSNYTRKAFADHYQKLMMEKRYDFMMGSKLKYYAEKYKLRVMKELEISDPEFTFSGPANDNVLNAWQDRFKRMTGFNRALGKKVFNKVTHEFLNCIKRDDHTSLAKINFIIAELVY